MGANGGPSTADWRAQMAGEDAKAVELLSRYKTPSDFLKAHEELRGKLSQRSEAPKPPGEASTPDEVAAYRKAFDVPDVPKEAKDEQYADAYGLKLPEGVAVPQALLGAFAKQMNSAHVPKPIVQKVIGEFGKIQLAMQAQQEKVALDKRREWTNQMRDELGSAEYEGHVAAAKGWLQDQFRENPDGLERLAAYQAPDGGLLGDDPFFIKLFAEKGMAAGYTDIIQANALESGGKSLAQQQQEIEALQFKDPAAYNAAAAPNGRLDKLIAARIAKGELDEFGNENRRRRTA